MSLSKRLITTCSKRLISSKISKMSRENCVVAVCQLTSTNNKESNLKSVKRLVKNAVKQKARVIFLPEACDYVGTNKTETKALAETLDGPLMNEYKKLAKSHNVWLSIGGFHEIVNLGSELKLNNCHVIINANGEIESTYRKLHLFDVLLPEKNINLQESENVLAGKKIVSPVKTPAGAVGLAIDMRFPEYSVILRKLGADILTYPSAFTNITGQAHWETLLRCRAIENQCYVIAAAQYGQHNSNRTSFGCSMIIDPWGNIMAQCSKYADNKLTDESVAVATINPNFVEKVRSDMPVFQHRRNDLYQIDILEDDFASQNVSHFMFAEKVIPACTVFYKSQYSYAFTNIRCVVPGHVLVASIRKAPRLENLTSAEVADLFQTVVKVQKIMETVHGSKSSTICVQDGQFAGQTVPHIHCHILPRKPGDFERNDDIYQELARHDRSENPNTLRSIDEMREEAEMLRSHFLN